MGKGIRFMVQGMVYGLWFRVYGLGYMGYGRGGLVGPLRESELLQDSWLLV